ncbi:hypothetical protein K3495_g8741 [Podosphaera aphanis]|nr:hypothetical protein K3495_g8741 [Podosphaera aphanis]
MDAAGLPTFRPRALIWPREITSYRNALVICRRPTDKLMNRQVAGLHGIACGLALEPAERDRYGFQCRLISERSVRQGFERVFVLIKDISPSAKQTPRLVSSPRIRVGVYFRSFPDVGG